MSKQKDAKRGSITNASAKNPRPLSGEVFCYVSETPDPVVQNLLWQGVDLGIIDNSDLGEIYKRKENHHINKRQYYARKVKNFFGYSLAIIFLYILMYSFLVGLVKLIGIFKNTWFN